MIGGVKHLRYIYMWLPVALATCLAHALERLTNELQASSFNMRLQFPDIDVEEVCFPGHRILCG